MGDETCLREIKNEFYEWCGLLSVDEVCSNPRLIGAIENIERELISACHRAEDAVF